MSLSVTDVLIYRSLFWPCGCCVWLNNDCIIGSNVNNSGLIVFLLLIVTSSAFLHCQWGFSRCESPSADSGA